MRYRVTIVAGASSFTADMADATDVLSAVSMVQSGAQVRSAMLVEIHDAITKAELRIARPTCLGMVDAVAAALGAVENMPPRPHDPRYNRDFSARVHLAVDGSVSLNQAEGWLTDVIDKALNEHANEPWTETGQTLLFQHNGVPIHGARWE